MGIAALTKPKDAAHSMTIGFADDGFWSQLHYEVTEDTAAHKRLTHKALCLTETKDVSNVDVAEWCRESYVVALPVCNLEPSAKKIHLRDDHGSEVLRLFAQRVVASPYVEEVVNSLPFRPNACRFIENIDENTGIVNLRLYRDDRGLGMAVKTTGTTRDQLERISKSLNEHYGY